MPFTSVQSQGDCSQPNSSCPSCCNYTKDCSFNCHQYVRGCILGDVNLSTGVPYDDDDICDHNFESVSNSHPVWELGYQRQFFRFSDLEDEDDPLTFGVGDDDVLVNAPEP